MIYQTCSGCYESVDGHNSFDYPYDEEKKCLIGSGCEECDNKGYLELPDDYYESYAEFHEKQVESERYINYWIGELMSNETILNNTFDEWMWCADRYDELELHHMKAAFDTRKFKLETEKQIEKDLKTVDQVGAVSDIIKQLLTKFGVK